jgi:hypothetical protein
VKYLLFEEKFWPHTKFDFFKEEYHKDFRELRRWNHESIGQMILFEVIK